MMHGQKNIKLLYWCTVQLQATLKTLCMPRYIYIHIYISISKYICLYL